MVAFSLVTDDIQGQTVILWPNVTFNCSAADMDGADQLLILTGEINFNT